jgi:tryptophan synthase beta chain
VAEAAGEGIATGRHAAALLGGTPGILHGSRSYMLQGPDGQVIEAVSISAGLDYPGIGPQLAALMEAGRLVVSSATDTEAVAAVRQVARTEGILAAVESAHAVAALPDVLSRIARDADTRLPNPARSGGVPPSAAGPLPREAVVVLGLSGRGDKDLAALGLNEVGR